MIGSLCTGSGGLDLGVLAALGGRVAWCVDPDPHIRRILAARMPGIPNLGDLRAIDWAHVEPVDLVTVGFPCQDISAAGKRAGIREGTRSGLWTSIMAALRLLRPAYILVENVAALRWRGGGLDTVLADLAEAGFDALWHSVRASDIGAPHRRERVFLLAWNRSPQGTATNVIARRPSEPGRDSIRTSGAANAAAQPVGASAGQAWSTGTALEDIRFNRSAGNRLLPTPASSTPNDGEDPDRWLARRARQRARGVNGNGMGMPLPIAVRLLPTPTAADLSSPNRGAGPADEPVLGHEQTALFPTPRASEGTKGSPNQRGSSGDLTLSSSIVRLPPRNNAATDQHREIDWGDYIHAIRRWETMLDQPAPHPTEPGRHGRPRLSAVFTEWLMGMRSGWITDLGLPRTAQLRALGNAVVPDQAAHATRLLISNLAALTTPPGRAPSSSISTRDRPTDHQASPRLPTPRTLDDKRCGVSRGNGLNHAAKRLTTATFEGSR